MKKPFAAIIIAIAAVTLDGRIALHRGHPSDWTSHEDRRFLRSFLDTCDVIVIGNNTYRTAKKPLSKRNCIVFTRSVPATKRLANNLLLCNPRGANLRALLNQYKKVAVLGGSAVYTYFLEKNLLDKLYLTIEPLVFGKGLSLFASCRALRKPFRLISIQRLNKKGSILLCYQRA